MIDYSPLLLGPWFLRVHTKTSLIRFSFTGTELSPQIKRTQLTRKSDPR
jgi:hypothetical protein